MPAVFITYYLQLITYSYGISQSLHLSSKRFTF